MTAEQRTQLEIEMSHRFKQAHIMVLASDMSELLSLLASLRAANAEQRAVIERLTRPEPERCPHCGQANKCLPNCEYRAISARQKARAADVAAFIRDPDELGKVKP